MFSFFSNFCAGRTSILIALMILERDNDKTFPHKLIHIIMCTINFQLSCSFRKFHYANTIFRVRSCHEISKLYKGQRSDLCQWVGYPRYNHQNLFLGLFEMDQQLLYNNNGTIMGAAETLNLAHSQPWQWNSLQHFARGDINNSV